MPTVVRSEWRLSNRGSYGGLAATGFATAEIGYTNKRGSENRALFYESVFLLRLCGGQVFFNVNLLFILPPQFCSHLVKHRLTQFHAQMRSHAPLRFSKVHFFFGQFLKHFEHGVSVVGFGTHGFSTCTFSFPARPYCPG